MRSLGFILVFIIFSCGLVSTACSKDSTEILIDESEWEKNEGEVAGPLTPAPVNSHLNLEELPDGRPISSIKVRGSGLSLAQGLGYTMSESQYQEYLEIKRDSKTQIDHRIRWAFMNLETGTMVDQSLSADLKIFGASSSKIFVASTLLDKEEGELSNGQLQMMADMLVVSSNSAWTSLQKDIGNGSADAGRKANYEFTQRMGYPKTRGWQGYWGEVHGNELVATETVNHLYDIYHNQFVGADWLWVIMHTCRTGSTRGRKYFPSNMIVGGKTGTYDGPTENPQTGEEYTVRMRNHVLVFNVDGVQYGMAIFANNGSSESVALLAGGLLREYTSVSFSK